MTFICCSVCWTWSWLLLSCRARWLSTRRRGGTSSRPSGVSPAPRREGEASLTRRNHWYSTVIRAGRLYEVVSQEGNSSLLLVTTLLHQHSLDQVKPRWGLSKVQNSFQSTVQAIWTGTGGRRRESAGGGGSWRPVSQCGGLDQHPAQPDISRPSRLGQERGENPDLSKCFSQVGTPSGTLRQKQSRALSSLSYAIKT